MKNEDNSTSVTHTLKENATLNFKLLEVHHFKIIIEYNVFMSFCSQSIVHSTLLNAIIGTL